MPSAPARFRAVFTDPHKFPVGVEREVLSRLPCEITPVVCRTEEDTIAACREAHAILTASAPFSRRVIAELGAALVICRYGIGVDTVDIPAATEHGIIVANVPDFCFDQVADTAMSLILSVPRKVAHLSSLIKRGIYNRELAQPIHNFRGATLGLVAFGNIARNVARKAIPFGFRLLAFDPYLKPEDVREYPVSLVDFDTLLRESDLISVHSPLTTETRHLFNEAAFRKMKPSAYFFNCGRGPVHDQQALYRALKEGWIAGAGLDVLEKEPPDPHDPILTLDNVVLTPHYASYTEEAYHELRVKTAENAAAVLEGRFPKYLVNPEVKGRARLLQHGKPH
ncbi:MAG TPA: C-terminal binding protein [Candidatus Methylomirabilis sp.]|nr:C-terminal binding protein [Candidatus Methylomirabilis sp.]